MWCLPEPLVASGIRGDLVSVVNCPLRVRGLRILLASATNDRNSKNSMTQIIPNDIPASEKSILSTRLEPVLHSTRELIAYGG